MKLKIHRANDLAFLVTLFSMLFINSCGQKDTVEEFDDIDSKAPSRSRLTEGSSGNTSLGYCELPLELGTVLDPKRPGQTQTVLSTSLSSDCARPSELTVKVRSRLKVTLIGRFSCKRGQQADEQICSIPASEVISQNKSLISIPVMAESAVLSRDIQASVTIYGKSL
jgi:hypothetical protein